MSEAQIADQCNCSCSAVMYSLNKWYQEVTKGSKLETSRTIKKVESVNYYNNVVLHILTYFIYTKEMCNCQPFFIVI